MSKPKPKKEVAIDRVLKEMYAIIFYASSDVIQDVREFGSITPGSNPNQYWLWIDKRFDFDEVLNYLENYDTPPAE